MLDHRSGFVRSHGWLGERSNLPWASKMDLLDLLEQQNVTMPRRYLVWLKPPGTQICIRLESCFLDFAFARGKLEIRKGGRRFFEPVWHIIYIYIYICIYRIFSLCPFVRLFSMILFVASETTRLSRRWCWLLACWANGYCRGTLSLSKNSQTVQTVWLYHCTKRSRVQCHWIYLLPRWFERWI